MKYAIDSVKVLAALFVLLFALITFLAGAYLQTLTLALLAVILFYWPFFRRRKGIALASRMLLALLVVTLQFTAFRGGPKTSIYLSEAAKREVHAIYAEKAARWPEGTQDIFIDTKYGRVHVLAFGDEALPPLLMMHAASMGGHSWAENLPPLLGKYRVYAIDNLGEGNLSELTEATVFPQTQQELADLYAFIADQLGVERSPVLGASNGGYLAQVYTYHYPERVQSLALFGPMGLTPLSGKSIFMLSVASLFPLDAVRARVARWAFGRDTYCHRRYGDWFDAILRGTIPSVARPHPMTDAQKEAMDLPVLLFLGTADPIVGEAAIAREAAEKYPNIRIEVLESGHLIAVEQRAYINNRLAGFLKKI